MHNDTVQELVYNPYTFDTNKRSMYIVYEDTAIYEFQCTFGNLFSSKHTITKLINHLNKAFNAGIEFAQRNNLKMTYPDLMDISPFTIATVDKFMYSTEVINYRGGLFMKCNDSDNIKNYAALFNAAYREGIYSLR